MLDLVKEYAEKRLDLLKMEATEKSSVTAGTFTFLAIAVVAGLFFLILFNIGLGLLIGSYLGNYAYGLLIMAGFYLLIILIVFLVRNSIKNAVANKIIQSLNS
ncbi:phage holin family protein [Kaistella faecalis]|uniref:phage holin family protein n=1 Tax=Kaistella faecalis TaxID=2852098 RepID=UPI001C480D87|nr:phage holin family protein [Chryseobacterium faecale]UFK97877.1 phage holin family protein [Chryseobacterium faecale]